MSWRVALLSVLMVVMISGCAPARSGAEFAALSQIIGPPKTGQARIVVFREQAYGGLFDVGWDVKLDGQTMRDLKTGTYVYADRPAGRHQLSSSMAMFPDVTQRDFTVAPGKTYYFLARLSERARALNSASAVGGLSGFVVASVVTSEDSNPGPLDFIPLEATAAREAISAIRLAD